MRFTQNIHVVDMILVGHDNDYEIKKINGT